MEFIALKFEVFLLQAVFSKSNLLFDLLQQEALKTLVEILFYLHLRLFTKEIFMFFAD